MQRRFTTLDVFTAERFAGNPLAVVHDSEGLDTKRMQAIAREFGLPETVFIHPAADPAHAAHLRIFTPVAELPFAGHPTVGTAALLALMNKHNAPAHLILEEQIGAVHCDAVVKGGELAQARFMLPVLPRKIAWQADGAAIAAALNLTAQDIDGGSFEPQKWSAGIDVCFVPVNALAALAHVRADVSRWEHAFGASGPRVVYLFTAQGNTAGTPARSFRARMFAPLIGIQEDPATGSAAAAFAGLLAQTPSFFSPASGGGEEGGSGTHKIVIEQGYEMGRPSVIHLEMQMGGGTLTAASIAGDAVVVTEGTLNA
jgi:trans-2,3-dihydro-3-hydroxyanthranilate isomerase